MASEDTTAILQAIAELAKGQAVMAANMVTRAEFEAAIAALGREIAEQGAELRAELRAELHSVRAEIMARIDRLGDSFSLIKDDVTVNYAAAAQTERIARTALEQVQGFSDMMMALQRQIRRLTNHVFGPDDLH